MTAATGDMVDDKDEAMKPELQLDVDLDIRGPDIRDLDLDIRGPDIRDFDLDIRGPDRDLDLDIRDLDLDIRDLDLDIRGLDISDLDFSGLDRDLDLDIRGLDIRDLDFSGLDIRGLDISDLDFSGLDLDKADSGVLNAIERRDAILGQRLATAVYLTSGGLAVVHMATFGVVMTLAG